nr:MAG TPA: hypothetical protein [Caudoviricetes sp.]
MVAPHLSQTVKKTNNHLNRRQNNQNAYLLIFLVYILFEIYSNYSTKKALVRLTNADLLCYNAYIRYAGKLGV